MKLFSLFKYLIISKVEISNKKVACKSTNGVPEIVYDKVPKLKLNNKAFKLFNF